LIFIFGRKDIETSRSRKLIGDMKQSKKWRKEGTSAENMRRQLLGKEKKRKNRERERVP